MFKMGDTVRIRKEFWKRGDAPGIGIADGMKEMAGSVGVIYGVDTYGGDGLVGFNMRGLSFTWWEEWLQANTEFENEED